MIGIYKITCKGNNQIYIGSSIDIKDRWLHHLSDLRNNVHHSTYLQRSFNRYGENSLTFEVLLEMIDYDEELLRLNEFYYIEKYKPAFNSMVPASCDYTKEWRDKISQSTKKLYTEGYINPRKGVGKRYYVMDIHGDIVLQDKTITEIADYFKASYHTYNSTLRKYNGVCALVNNFAIMSPDKTIFDIIYAYKNTTFFRNCNVCDLQGNTYRRSDWYSKGRPHKGKGISYASIYKQIITSENLYVKINNDIFTLPFLCHFIQQCISNNS